MEAYIKEFGISYIEEGAGKPLVIFHGWGCNKEMFQFMIDKYKEKYRVIVFDLPGFGKSAEPTSPMDTQDYAQKMEKVFQFLNLENPIVMGHSFGGRILIKMATFMKFQKMILLGSAGIVNKRPFKYYLKVYTYKTLKKIYSIGFIQKKFPGLLDRYRQKSGSSDYNSASEMMKRILSISVNEDLRDEFYKVKVSTLLIWGELDNATPLSDAKLMEKEFEDAGLVIFEGAGHYAFLEQKSRFLTVLDAFI